MGMMTFFVVIFWFLAVLVAGLVWILVWDSLSPLSDHETARLLRLKDFDDDRGLGRRG